MASALDYFKKGKSIYGNNFEKEIKKHFGFFPFDVISTNNLYVTKEIFFKADHPIKISLDKKRWSCGIVVFDIKNFNEILENIGDKNIPNPFIQSIWNLLTFKKSNKQLVSLKTYEKTLMTLNKIFYMKNFDLVIKNKKYEKCFSELRTLLEKIA